MRNEYFTLAFLKDLELCWLVGNTTEYLSFVKEFRNEEFYMDKGRSKVVVSVRWGSHKNVKCWGHVCLRHRCGLPFLNMSFYLRGVECLEECWPLLHSICMGTLPIDKGDLQPIRLAKENSVTWFMHP